MTACVALVKGVPVPQAGRYRNETAPFEWLESFAELESLIKEAGEPLKRAFCGMFPGQIETQPGVPLEKHHTVTASELDSSGLCVLCFWIRAE